LIEFLSDEEKTDKSTNHRKSTFSDLNSTSTLIKYKSHSKASSINSSNIHSSLNSNNDKRLTHDYLKHVNAVPYLYMPRVNKNLNDKPKKKESNSIPNINHSLQSILITNLDDFLKSKYTDYQIKKIQSRVRAEKSRNNKLKEFEDLKHDNKFMKTELLKKDNIIEKYKKHQKYCRRCGRNLDNEAKIENLEVYKEEFTIENRLISENQLNNVICPDEGRQDISLLNPGDCDNRTHKNVNVKNNSRFIKLAISFVIIMLLLGFTLFRDESLINSNLVGLLNEDINNVNINDVIYSLQRNENLEQSEKIEEIEFIKTGELRDFSEENKEYLDEDKYSEYKTFNAEYYDLFDTGYKEDKEDKDDKENNFSWNQEKDFFHQDSKNICVIPMTLPINNDLISSNSFKNIKDFKLTKNLQETKDITIIDNMKKMDVSTIIQNDNKFIG